MLITLEIHRRNFDWLYASANILKSFCLKNKTNKADQKYPLLVLCELVRRPSAARTKRLDVVGLTSTLTRRI